MKLLLIEDDPAMQLSLTRSFERRGLQVAACNDGAQAIGRWQASAPDVVILDLSLPGLDGLEVLARARKAGLSTPVLILTARGTVGDRILGLNVGADDYLPKPFDLDELMARVQALGRRAGAGNAVNNADPQGKTFCGMRVDAESGAVYHAGTLLELTPREGALLRALLARPGSAIAKERLFDAVFPGADEVQLEAIEVVAYRLRKRIAHTGAQLVTLRGLGYLLKAQA
ncbi:response regulator transcription factor [Roseateles oligotrophus]|uniref:Response regulator transcription factor n=1 Tax=Roseateles oligotrophus TaxID=1769250 RepID=A0ABT2Y948_9BURK|nr:response regulator transcription factor [Roseateles oligotrophus]MCV2366822.1 response regulator transcription factor [Roseateles oligotrophus]